MEMYRWACPDGGPAKSTDLAQWAASALPGETVYCHPRDLDAVRAAIGDRATLPEKGSPQPGTVWLARVTALLLLVVLGTGSAQAAGNITFRDQTHDFRTMAFNGQYDILDYSSLLPYPIVVSSTTGDSGEPDAATDGTTLVVVWEESYGGLSEIYSAVSTDGRRWVYWPVPHSLRGETPNVRCIGPGVFRVTFRTPGSLQPVYYTDYDIASGLWSLPRGGTALWLPLLLGGA